MKSWSKNAINETTEKDQESLQTPDIRKNTICYKIISLYTINNLFVVLEIILIKKV